MNSVTMETGPRHFCHLRLVCVHEPMLPSSSQWQLSPEREGEEWTCVRVELEGRVEGLLLARILTHGNAA